MLLTPRPNKCLKRRRYTAVLSCVTCDFYDFRLTRLESVWLWVYAVLPCGGRVHDHFGALLPTGCVSRLRDKLQGRPCQVAPLFSSSSAQRPALVYFVSPCNVADIGSCNLGKFCRLGQGSNSRTELHGSSPRDHPSELNSTVRPPHVPSDCVGRTIATLEASHNYSE